MNKALEQVKVKMIDINGRPLNPLLTNLATVNVKYYGVKGDGKTDDTETFQLALDDANTVTTRLVVPAGQYIISKPLTITGNGYVEVVGEGVCSALLNKASANTPTFFLNNKTYFALKDFSILGDVLYPNDGIYMLSGGFGRFDNVFLCPNGTGIHLSSMNSLVIDNCTYWPSGYGAGASCTNSLRLHAILGDGVFINDIHINELTASNYTTVPNGGSAIKIAPSSNANNIHVHGGDLEGVPPAANSRVFEWSKVGGGSIKGTFIENTNSLFLGCTNLEIDQAALGSTATLTFGDGTVPGRCVYTSVSNVSPDAIIVNANCYQTIFENCVPNTFTDLGTATSWRGGSISGTDTQDRVAPFGMRTWARGFPDGVHQTYAFNAGDFTASSGTWTVNSGNITDISWSLVGKQMTASFYLDTTTLSGGPASFLQWKLPNSYTVGGTARIANTIRTVNNGVTGSGLATAFAGSSNLSFSVNLAGGTWANATDCSIIGSITFWIT